MTSRLSELIGKRPHTALGIMSGTSCDGVDLCVASVMVQADGNVSIQAGPHSTLPYPSSMSERLISSRELPVAKLSSLSFELGGFFADCVSDFLEEHGLAASGIDVIGSHGHTVFHNPPQNGQSSPQCAGVNTEQPETSQTRESPGQPASSKTPGPPGVPATLQIGEPSTLSERTGIVVVSDFRAADVAAGGQGAPLVPFVDYLMFRKFPETAALNIGGIANVTVIGESLGDTFAFDTGPGNCLIDEAVRLLSGGESRFDVDGKLAATGRFHRPALDTLLENPYFDTDPPKSLDREQFGHSMALTLIDMMKDIDKAAVVATATEFTARTIHRAFEKFVFPNRKITQVIVSGGGIHNLTLLRRLEELLRPVHVISSTHFGIDADAKEAMAFAVLAGLCLAGLPGNIPSATGARRPVILGKITQ